MSRIDRDEEHRRMNAVMDVIDEHLKGLDIVPQINLVSQIQCEVDDLHRKLEEQDRQEWVDYLKELLIGAPSLEFPAEERPGVVCLRQMPGPDSKRQEPYWISYADGKQLLNEDGTERHFDSPWAAHFYAASVLEGVSDEEA